LALVAVDTNVLAYAEGVRRSDRDGPKLALARHLIESLIVGSDQLCIPAQVLAELHYVLRRKALLTTAEARARVSRYLANAEVIATDRTVIARGLTLVERHGLQTYDAIILSAVASAECDVLLSEDMQDGFEWQGVRVVNPFA
jgi:predicted nucleic acid-binding protein